VIGVHIQKDNVVVVEEGKEIRLTVQGAQGITCIYVRAENGKLVLTGGASIVERIEGEGFRGKIVGR